jgi:hypothetical protein
MPQNDLWAANGVACLKAACAAADQKKRAVLIHLGGFWLDLAHAPPAQIDSVLAGRIVAMERIQAGLLGTRPTLHKPDPAWPTRLPLPGREGALDSIRVVAFLADLLRSIPAPAGRRHRRFRAYDRSPHAGRAQRRRPGRPVLRGARARSRKRGADPAGGCRPHARPRRGRQVDPADRARDPASVRRMVKRQRA